MCPLEIEILLWYHARANDYRDGDFSAPAVRGAINSFLDPTGWNLLRPLTTEDSLRTGLSYKLTERGEAFVVHILALPLPVCRWEMPGAGFKWEPCRDQFRA